MSTKLIEVTKYDIKNGITSYCLCPIALAACRTFNKDKVGVATYLNLSPGSCNEEDLIPLPGEALNFIDKFDLGQDVEPFSFSVEVKKA